MSTHETIVPEKNAAPEPGSARSPFLSFADILSQTHHDAGRDNLVGNSLEKGEAATIWNPSVISQARCEAETKSLVQAKMLPDLELFSRANEIGQPDRHIGDSMKESTHKQIETNEKTDLPRERHAEIAEGKLPQSREAQTSLKTSDSNPGSDDLVYGGKGFRFENPAMKHRKHAEGDNKELNPINHRNPRVVDDQTGKIMVEFPLKTAATLYDGDGHPLMEKGAPVEAHGSVRLSYGMKKEMDYVDAQGQKERGTFYMAWQATPGNKATGWVNAKDFTAAGAAAAEKAIPVQLGNTPPPEGESSKIFTIDGNNQTPAIDATSLKYIGVTFKHLDKIANFLNLHEREAGPQLLMNLPNVSGGGIAMDLLHNGDRFVAAKGPGDDGLLVAKVDVQDGSGAAHKMAFVYGHALSDDGSVRWGWVGRAWLKGQEL